MNGAAHRGHGSAPVKTPIRVAVLGVAHYHANFWSEVFGSHPDARLAGVWDPEPQRARDFAARYKAEAFEDLDRLMRRCDAVAITSETCRHRLLVERAAAQGHAVLCEKPIATTLADARAIAAAVRSSGIVFMQSFPKRFDPVNHEIARLVRSGDFGTISLVRVRHGHFYGLGEAFRQQWFVDPVQSGGGSLMDEGVHGADFLRWLFGAPESVSATVSSSTVGLGVDDAAIAVFRWANGMLAELATSWSFAAAGDSIEIYGTHGTARLAGVDLGSRDLTRGEFLHTWFGKPESGVEREWNASPIVPRFKTGGFHQQNALAFVQALAQGTPAPIDVDDGVGALAMITAAYDSARRGCVVKIPGPDD